MKKFTISLFFTLFTISNVVFGQCPDSPCFGAPQPGDSPTSSCITCDLSDLDGFQGTTMGFTPNIDPGPFCGSVENNQFIPFVASQPNITFTIDANNCQGTPMGTGVQAEVYGSLNCSTDWMSFSNCASTGTQAPFTINAAGMTPGGVYYLMIDGWANDICDFTITVTNPAGGGVAPPLPAPDPISPSENVCIPEGGTATHTYSVPEVGGAQEYIWTATGATASPSPTAPNMVSVTFDTPGPVQICVEASNACSTSPQTCQTIIVSQVINPPTDFMEFCPGDDVVCGGQVISNPPPGLQTITLQSYLGCDSIITCELEFIFIDLTVLPAQTECAPFCIDVCGTQYCDTEEIAATCTSYQGCDSLVFLDLVVLDPMVSIAPPNQIGCSGGAGQITLDGSNSSSAPPDVNITYEWTGPSFCGPTNEITACVDMAGQYCLTMTHERDGVECSDQMCVDVTENIQVPEEPTISAPPGPVCEGDLVTYTVNNFSGPQPSGYTFTVTPNQPVNVIDANTFEVDWTGSMGGEICATPESDCGDGPPACITVDISAGPVDPTFSGELIPCADQTYSYSIDNADPNATYAWTAPGAVVNGSGDFVDIDFGSAGTVEICVTCTNTCGTSNPYCETVTVVGPPAMPTFLSGSMTVCGTANEEYCVNNDPNALDYSWVTPVGNINNTGNCETLDWMGSTGGQICVTANNDCGSSQPFCFDVVVDEGPTATLSGMGAVCENSMDDVDLTVNFTGTGPWTFVYNDGNADVTVMSSDAIFMLTVTAAGTYTPVSVTDQSACSGSVSGSATVTQNPQPTAILSGNASICENSGMPAMLTITLTGTPPWTVNYTTNTNPAAPLTGLMNMTETLSIPEAQAGDIQITSVTDGNGCTNNTAGTIITVEVNDAPIVANIQTPCNTTNDGYNVTFEITGGDPATYSVTPNTGTISAAPPYIFTSDEIASGTGYNFTVNDGNNCSPANVSQNSVICACDTEVGTMAQMVMRVCGDGPITATYDNTNEASDADDVLIYYLHTGSGVSIVNEIATNPTEPTFSFMAGMTYGTTYYISAVNGNDDGMGGIDLDDGCTAVAQGTPIVFLELPTATLGAGVSVCAGEEATLIVTFTGTGPWNLEYDAGNGPETINGINVSSYNLNLTVTTNTTVTLTGVVSDYPAIDCPGMASGTATITANTAVQVVNADETCNPMGTQYTVSFEITDGDPTSYSVVPAGTISAGPPYIFTSNPIATGMGYSFTVDDANNCNPLMIGAPTVVCDCNTEVGVMNTDALTVCGDGPTTAMYDDTDQNFDGDDVLNFVLHTGISTTLGNVLQLNQIDAEVIFDGTMMNYGTVYYISAIVGNDDGTGIVDVADPCLDVAAGTPVVFYEVPTGDLTADANICNGGNASLSVGLAGDAPWSLTITDDQGGSEDYTNINMNPFTVMVSPTTTTVYTLATVSDESGCPGDATGMATITVNNAPTLTPPTFTFNGTNTGYTVSFEIMGGDPATYAVTPANGTISAGPPYIFNSNEIPCGNGFNFSVDDVNGCGPVVASQAMVTCNCDTEAGMMVTSADPLTACGNGPIVAMYDGGETLDANDAASFVLLDGATVLNSSTMPSFGYNQNNMTYGQTYQICAAAGDDNGSGIASQNDACFDIGTICVDIIFYQTPTATLSVDGSICTGDSLEITVDFTGTPPFDFTYENNTSGEEFSETGIMANSYDFFVSPTATANFSLVSAMDANGCAATLSGLSNIMVQNAPTAGQPTEDCNVTNTEFTVSFQISGGDATSYTVTGTNMGTIDASGLFTSDPLPTGSSYSYLVDDGNGCGPFEVSGAFACDCETEVGTIVETELNLCEGETATITHNGAVLDPDDILVYILHDGSAVPFGTIVQQSATPSFDFDTGNMTFGTTYFIAALVGNDDGTGMVNENEPCFDIVEIPVTWGQTPTGMFGDDVSYCGTSTAEIPFVLPLGTFDIVIEDENGVTSNANGFQNGDVLTLPNISQTTTFTIVSITDTNTGCAGTSADEIVVTINPSVNAGNDAALSFCGDANENVDLFATLGGSPDTDGTWTDDGGNVVPNGMTTTVGLAIGSFDYTYTVAGQAPCSDGTSIVTITLSAGPTADAGTDQILTCAEETVSIGGTNTTSGATYFWDGPAVSSPNAANTTATAPGIYTLTVTDADGCTATDQVEVTLEFTIPYLELNVSNADCFGDSNGFISVDSVGNGQPPYLYSFNGDEFKSESTFTNLGAGQYSIIVQDANGCEQELTPTIIEPEEVDVNLIGNFGENNTDNSINLGDELLLTVVSSPSFAELDSILWTPPLAIDCDTCETNVVSPQSQMTYNIYVEEGGCSDTDELTVYVGKDLEVYVPNVFSPNNDGENDFVTVQGDAKIVANINSFMIFNRWGESVHSISGTDLLLGNSLLEWDGTYRGKRLDSQSFVWFTEVLFVDGTVKLFKGDVTLIK